jgi:predicted  nucleic acid-binding Zn-ribbon protein
MTDKPSDIKEQLRILQELKKIDSSLVALTKAFEELKKDGDLTDDDITEILREFESFSSGKESQMEDVRNDLLRVYERYFSKFGERAIVPVKGGVCSGCFIAIPPMRLDKIRAMDEIIYCENCGRILVWEEDSVTG